MRPMYLRVAAVCDRIATPCIGRKTIRVVRSYRYTGRHSVTVSRGTPLTYEVRSIGIFSEATYLMNT